MMHLCINMYHHVLLSYRTFLKHPLIQSEFHIESNGLMAFRANLPTSLPQSPSRQAVREALIGRPSATRHTDWRSNRSACFLGRLREGGLPPASFSSIRRAADRRRDPSAAPPQVRSFRRPVRAERLINLDETICDKIERLLLQRIRVHAGEVNFIAFGDWHLPCVDHDDSRFSPLWENLVFFSRSGRSDGYG